MKLQDKYAEIAAHETEVETKYTDDAEVVLVGFGIVSRILNSAVEQAREGLSGPETLCIVFPEGIVASPDAVIRALNQMLPPLCPVLCSPHCSENSGSLGM